MKVTYTQKEVLDTLIGILKIWHNTHDLESSFHSIVIEDEINAIDDLSEEEKTLLINSTKELLKTIKYLAV